MTRELTADQLKKLWKSLRQFIRKKTEKTFQTIQKYGPKAIDAVFASLE